MAKKRKRKLSAYNLFVKRQVKAGKSFVQAARAWRSGSKSPVRKLKTRKKSVVKRKVRTMARRRTRSRRVSARSRPSNNYMKGMFPIGGLFGKVIIGAGVAALQEAGLPQVVPYQSAAAGFLVGGIPGAAGALVKGMLQGGGAVGITGGNY